MRARPLVTLLTDFGARDPFVGAMKGVILGLCRDATIVDLCHEVPAYDIAGGSFLLSTGTSAFPAGTIHVAVVDPGVGSARRPILAELDDQVFVAPDNGLLSYVVASAERRRLRHLAARQYWRPSISPSFHGRDIFAPVAGHLAAGVAPERFGPEIDDPLCLEIARPAKDPAGSLRGTVVWVDRFGNCITNVSRRDLDAFTSITTGGGIRVHVGGRPLGVLVDHFAGVTPGQTGAILGSTGYVELFCNQGDLARQWRLGRGDPVLLEATTRA